MEDAFGRRETLTVTHNHPYLRAANDNSPGILNAVRLDPGGDWSAAGLLKPGDHVQSAIGAHLVVVSVEPVEGLAAKVYNLEVADHHTYAVGELQAWAHNAKGKGTPRPPGGRDNKRANGSFDDAYREAIKCLGMKYNKKDKRKCHDVISGAGIESFQEMVAECIAELVGGGGSSK